jgi:hypothetical protein
MTQPKEEPKPEPAAEEKPAPGFDFRKLFESVSRHFFCVCIHFFSASLVQWDKLGVHLKQT